MDHLPSEERKPIRAFRPVGRDRAAAGLVNLSTNSSSSSSSSEVDNRRSSQTNGVTRARGRAIRGEDDTVHLEKFAHQHRHGKPLLEDGRRHHLDDNNDDDADATCSTASGGRGVGEAVGVSGLRKRRSSVADMAQSGGEMSFAMRIQEAGISLLPERIFRRFAPTSSASSAFATSANAPGHEGSQPSGGPTKRRVLFKQKLAELQRERLRSRQEQIRQSATSSSSSSSSSALCSRLPTVTSGFHGFEGPSSCRRFVDTLNDVAPSPPSSSLSLPSAPVVPTFPRGDQNSHRVAPLALGHQHLCGSDKTGNDNNEIDDGRISSDRLDDRHAQSRYGCLDESATSRRLTSALQSSCKVTTTTTTKTAEPPLSPSCRQGSGNDGSKFPKLAVADIRRQRMARTLQTTKSSSNFCFPFSSSASTTMSPMELVDEGDENEVMEDTDDDDRKCSLGRPAEDCFEKFSFSKISRSSELGPSLTSQSVSRGGPRALPIGNESAEEEETDEQRNGGRRGRPSSLRARLTKKPLTDIQRLRGSADIRSEKGNSDYVDDGLDDDLVATSQHGEIFGFSSIQLGDNFSTSSSSSTVGGGGGATHRRPNEVDDERMCKPRFDGDVALWRKSTTSVNSAAAESSHVKTKIKNSKLLHRDKQLAGDDIGEGCEDDAATAAAAEDVVVGQKISFTTSRCRQTAEWFGESLDNDEDDNGNLTAGSERSRRVASKMNGRSSSPYRTPNARQSEAIPESAPRRRRRFPRSSTQEGANVLPDGEEHRRRAEHHEGQNGSAALQATPPPRVSLSDKMARRAARTSEQSRTSSSTSSPCGDDGTDIGPLSSSSVVRRRGLDDDNYCNNDLSQSSKGPDKVDHYVHDKNHTGGTTDDTGGIERGGGSCSSRVIDYDNDYDNNDDNDKAMSTGGGDAAAIMRDDPARYSSFTQKGRPRQSTIGSVGGVTDRRTASTGGRAANCDRRRHRGTINDDGNGDDGGGHGGDDRGDNGGRREVDLSSPSPSSKKWTLDDLAGLSGFEDEGDEDCANWLRTNAAEELADSGNLEILAAGGDSVAGGIGVVTNGDADNSEVDECAVCLGDLGEAGVVSGGVNGCRHVFCFDCISKWSKVTNLCPLCKAKFNEIRKGGRKGPEGVWRGGEVVHVAEKSIRVEEMQSDAEGSGEEDPAIENCFCQVCGLSDEEAFLLLCDGCNRGYHTWCVGLGRELPEGNWFCEECAPFFPSHVGPEDEEVRERERATSSSHHRRHHRTRQRRDSFFDDDDCENRRPLSSASSRRTAGGRRRDEAPPLAESRAHGGRRSRSRRRAAVANQGSARSICRDDEGDDDDDEDDDGSRDNDQNLEDRSPLEQKVLSHLAALGSLGHSFRLGGRAGGAGASGETFGQVGLLGHMLGHMSANGSLTTTSSRRRRQRGASSNRDTRGGRPASRQRNVQRSIGASSSSGVGGGGGAASIGGGRRTVRPATSSSASRRRRPATRTATRSTGIISQLGCAGGGSDSNGREGDNVRRHPQGRERRRLLRPTTTTGASGRSNYESSHNNDDDDSGGAGNMSTDAAMMMPPEDEAAGDCAFDWDTDGFDLGNSDDAGGGARPRRRRLQRPAALDDDGDDDAEGVCEDGAVGNGEDEAAARRRIKRSSEQTEGSVGEVRDEAAGPRRSNAPMIEQSGSSSRRRRRRRSDGLDGNEDEEDVDGDDDDEMTAFWASLEAAADDVNMLDGLEEYL